MFEVFFGTNDPNDGILDGIAIVNQAPPDNAIVHQKIDILYNDDNHEFVPIFKDVYGTLHGHDRPGLLDHIFVRGLAVDFENISLIYRPHKDDPRSFVVSIPIDTFYEALGVNHFSLGVYHYADDDPESDMIEALDFSFDTEAEDIQLSIAYDDEAEAYSIPLYWSPDDDSDYDDDEFDGRGHA